MRKNTKPIAKHEGARVSSGGEPIAVKRCRRRQRGLPQCYGTTQARGQPLWKMQRNGVRGGEGEPLNGRSGKGLGESASKSTQQIFQGRTRTYRGETIEKENRKKAAWISLARQAQDRKNTENDRSEDGVREGQGGETSKRSREQTWVSRKKTRSGGPIEREPVNPRGSNGEGRGKRGRGGRVTKLERSWLQDWPYITSQ